MFPIFFNSIYVNTYKYIYIYILLKLDKTSKLSVLKRIIINYNKHIKLLMICSHTPFTFDSYIYRVADDKHK